LVSIGARVFYRWRTNQRFATGPALRVLGFAESDAAGHALARLAGSRGIALGLLRIAAPEDLAAPRAT
jgi:hypothetical protein